MLYRVTATAYSLAPMEERVTANRDGNAHGHALPAATMRDVAERAGVSTATVSRFLAGQTVRAADVVAAAIEELGFRPNPIAQSLSSGSTRSCALVVPDITNPFFASVVRGIEEVARAAGYDLVLYNTDEDPELEAHIIEQLRNRVDGVVIAPTSESESGVGLDLLDNLDIPAVLLDREAKGRDNHDSVKVDNEGGARQAIDHLVGLGHQRIALVTGSLGSTPGRERHEASVAALEAAGIDIDPILVENGGFKEDGGYQATLRLLALSKIPTAIFVHNNLMTVGALRAMRDMAIRIPQDISVVGFDDHHFANLLTPPLTVVSRPTVEQGVLAMRLLLNRFDPEYSAPSRHLVLETNLTIRQSCAPVPRVSDDK